MITNSTPNFMSRFANVITWTWARSQIDDATIFAVYKVPYDKIVFCVALVNYFQLTTKIQDFQLPHLKQPFGFLSSQHPSPNGVVK